MPSDISTILIVDDNPNNLRVLEDILLSEGYRVRAALNGETALRAAQSAAPDLVLLDIRMPRMDGYEVCRRLKAMPGVADVPVIFISALQEMDDKVHAFQAGGVDYIVKPFQAEEVLARSRTHIELARARRALADTNAYLERLVAQRTAALEESRNQLARTAREEHALRELLSVAHHSATLREYLSQALASLVATSGWRPPGIKSAIMLIRPEGRDQALEVVAGTGLGDEWLGGGKNVPIRSCIHLDGNICVEKAGALSPCYLRTLFNEPASHPAMCIPLATDGHTLGVLALFVDTDGGMDPGRDSFLQQVADVLSASIARHMADEQIAWLAYHDDLTGLPNRRRLSEQIGRLLPDLGRRGGRCAIVMIDLDRFKRLNDALGHNIGDKFLQAVGERLQSVLRPGDELYRWGGDEYVILLSDIGLDRMQAESLAQDIAASIGERLGETLRVAELDAHLAASIGIALFPDDGGNADELLKHADLAMHAAKQAGRGTVHFYRIEMQQEAERHLLLEKELRAALTEEQFTLHYQPQVDGDGRLIGGEALVRWQHPQRGLVPPGDFIPTAEDTGLIVPLGDWVLRAACQQLRAWKVGAGGTLAVNVSARQFLLDDFVERVRRVVEESGAAPETLELEVTESLLLADVEGAVGKMNALREFGVRFSVDDFGTGYSSLSYLRLLPVDQLKIDRSFVTDIHCNARNAAIARTIISLADNLGIKTIAEGVEKEEEAAFLREAGCDHFQGYYFGRPVAPGEFASRWLHPERGWTIPLNT